MTDVTHEFKVKAGGKKGERILRVIANDKDKAMTRRQVAEAAECTVGRVGEVVRYLTATGDEATKELVSHLAGGGAGGKAPQIVDNSVDEADSPKRTVRKAAPARGKAAKPRARKATAKAKAAK